MVPHLTTALPGPINEPGQRILESMSAIERWFRLEWTEHTPPVYTSVGFRFGHLGDQNPALMGGALASIEAALLAHGVNLGGGGLQRAVHVAAAR